MKFASQNLRNASQIAQCEALIRTLLTCEIIYDNFTCENYRFSNNHHSLLMDILYC